jgi:hypothetical protein
MLDWVELFADLELLQTHHFLSNKWTDNADSRPGRISDSPTFKSGFEKSFAPESAAVEI